MQSVTDAFACVCEDDWKARCKKMKENELAVGCAHLSAEIALSTEIANRTCYYATAVSAIISPR